MGIRIISIINKVLLLALFSLLLMGADSPTIYPNPSFPTNYQVVAGQNYSKGGQLTFKTITANSQNGLFNSHEGSILSAQITSVTGLPSGFSWDQIFNPGTPLNNALEIYGTLPSDIAPGTYQVSVTAIDIAQPQNSGTQTINFIVGSSVPQPTQETLQVIGTVESPVNVANMSQYFQVQSGSPAIDSYQVVDSNTLPPGISFVAAGNFDGIYTQAGTFGNVQVEAHNSAGWSLPLTITFIVSQPDSPPYPTQASLPITRSVGDPAGVNNMSNYFATAPSASPIDSYQVVDSTKLPAGISFAATGDFSGNYTQVTNGTDDVQVEAHNKAGWSAPFDVIFTVVPADAPPVPNPTPLNVNDVVGNPIATQNMSHYFTVSPSSSPISAYQVVDTTKLPGGITFTSDGNFHGTYTTAGSFPTVQVEAQNSAGWSTPFIVNFTISQADSAPIPAAPLNVSAKVSDPASVQNMSNYFTLGSGASPIIDYKILDASKLPPGLTFTTDGNIQGTYTQSGSYSVQIEAENKAGWSTPFTINFSVDTPPVPDASPLDINDKVSDTVNQSITGSFHVPTGASAIIDYKVLDQSTLPPGVTFTHGTATFTGTYTQGGIFNVQVEAENNAGWSAPLTVKFTIDSAPFAQPKTLSESGQTGQGIHIPLNGDFQLNTGASAIDSYQIANGTTLPPGVTLNTTTGALDGTYTQANTFTAQIEAHNLAGWSDPLTVTFTISAGSSATLYCPDYTLLQNCPASVIVNDSKGVPHTFSVHACDQLIVLQFNAAKLRDAAGVFPDGLECQYIALNGGASVSYALDPAPTGTYFGSDPTLNQSYNCTGTNKTDCPFNVP